jgi:hypothetical protein
MLMLIRMGILSSSSKPMEVDMAVHTTNKDRIERVFTDMSSTLRVFVTCENEYD